MLSSQSLPLILVADASTEDAFRLRRSLEKAGIKNPVVTFNEADTLVSFLRATAVRGTQQPSLVPAILFVDAKLPRRGLARIMEWLELTSAVKKMPVVVTGGDAADPRRAKEGGAAYFTSKCPAPRELADIAAHARLRQ